MMQKSPMVISAGAKKDLLVLFFAKAIFQVALDRETNGSIQRDREDNKLHKINKRIDRRIQALMGKMENTIDEVITPDIANWLHGKTHGKIFSILTRMAKHETQLETMGLYVMYVNFCERKQKLDKLFHGYTDAGIYFDDIDLLKQTNIDEDIEAVAMNLAYDIVSEIKG